MLFAFFLLSATARSISCKFCPGEDHLWSHDGLGCGDGQTKCGRPFGIGGPYCHDCPDNCGAYTSMGQGYCTPALGGNKCCWRVEQILPRLVEYCLPCDSDANSFIELGVSEKCADAGCSDDAVCAADTGVCTCKATFNGDGKTCVADTCNTGANEGNNCSTCDTDTTTDCKACESGYTLDESKACISEDSCVDGKAGCKTCDADTAEDALGCKTCMEDYTLNAESKMCESGAIAMVFSFMTIFAMML